MVGKRRVKDPLLADYIIDNALVCEVGKRSAAEEEYFPKMNELLNKKDTMSETAFSNKWNKLEKGLWKDPRQVKYRKKRKKDVHAKSHMVW